MKKRTLKQSKIISLLLAVMMILSSLPFAGISALAATSSDFEYEILEDGTAEITGYYGEAETLEIPSTLDGYTVTRIGAYAFEDCAGLTNITIPNSVTSIGSDAFSGTGYYNDDANWENGVLYIGNHLIEANSDEIPSEYSINEGTIIIADGAFEFCYSLTSVTIPNSVTSIGYVAFGFCNGLTSITVDENNKNYLSQDGVLFNKEKTELIKYPAEKEGTSYNIPDSITSIGDYAFEDCYSLTSVTIQNSVTSIGDGAFAGCESLTSITIPDSVTSIGWSAFSGTGYYNDDTNWENGVLYIGNHLVEANHYNYGEVPAEYSVNEGTITIADYAFEYCESLTSIIIPDSVTSIGAYAFACCESLTSITIPDSVTSIGYDAFYGSAIETICGYENSYAQTYAEENGYEFVSLDSEKTGTPGDVNGDGKINALDVLIVKRYIAKYDDAKLEGDQFALADVSGDGKVNAKDALAIMQKISKLINSFDEIK